MAKYLLKREDIATVYQVICGEGMAAKVDVKTLHSGLSREPLEYQLDPISSHRFAIQGEKHAVLVRIKRFWPEVENVPL